MVPKTYKSFRVTKFLPLEELQSTLVEAIHEPTGARLIHIGNNDPENFFCLSFQTLPSSSNGVAHILEHTVLCGSKKFPIKDPFFSMTRRSLNTYMNALTGQDFTCYPASSQVEKDFYNLLEVYLDAVFEPELKKMSFLQEGHRLAPRDPTNPKSPLQFQGIVYNEMKGSLSSPESRLWEAVLKHLTPDLPYAVNSGGDPKEITNLTYEELKQFHQTFYHPSRCIFFFYGNLPLEKHIDFILKHTLEKANHLPPLPHIPRQKRFSEPISVTETYPIAETETLEKKTWIVFSFLTAAITSQEEVLALCLLDSLLMDTDASPLMLASLKSGLCTTAESSVDIEMSEVPFSFIFKGCDAKNAKKLKKILFDTLGKSTFTEEQIEASLHQLEFDRTEIGAGGVPFGLNLFFRSALIKQHGSEPESALLIHTLFRSLRNNLKDPKYLKNLIEKYFLKNPHYVELIFSPDPKKEAEERKEEEEKLEKLSKHVNREEILSLNEKLGKYQESLETQKLDCLPKITLRDIPAKSKDYPLFETKIENLHIFHHDCFTNQILYADLVFDLPHINEEDLSLVSLYAQFMTELGVGNRSYLENLDYQQAYTGGVSACLSLNITQEEQITPTLSIRGKALARNSEKLLDIFADLSQGADFSDLARVEELLQEHATEIENRLTKNALNYAVQRSLLGYSHSSFISEKWHGFSYYAQVKKWIQNPKKVAADLSRLQKVILAKGTPHLVLTCDKQTFDALHLTAFAKKLPYQPITPWRFSYTMEKQKHEAFFISSPVAFTARGQKSISFKDPRSAYLLLATELFVNCHLHKEVREKGGAYGSGSSYSPHTGHIHFYSFRDPQLAKTLDEFQNAIEKIGSANFSEQELEEAKFGAIQALDAPVPPGARGRTAYAWQRAGRTFEERQKFRNCLLNASVTDVASAVKELLAPHTGIIVSFLGENLYREEESKLKNPLDILTIH